MNSNKNCFTRCHYVFPSSGRICYKDIKLCCKNKHRMSNIEKELQEIASIKLIGKRYPCRAQVKKEVGSGYANCGRVNCKFHNRISDILNLPEIFCQYENNCQMIPTTDYFIEMYEMAHENFTQEHLVIFKDFLLDLFSMFGTLKKTTRFLFIAYLFHLLDTPVLKATFLKKCNRFKSTAIERLNYIFESNEICKMIRTEHSDFFSYMRHTFTADPNKKYFTKSKNTKYNMFLFKMSVKLFIAYQKSLEYTYRPGGSLYL